jgi:NADPH:quinone reductase-like Zn-dependent oxidoreductase
VKAIVQREYGSPDVLELTEVDKPAVAGGEVLVRVHAASVNAADWHLIRGEPYIARLSFGLRGPRDTVPGCDLAGEVEAVGENVTAFGPGDQVSGSPFMNGHGAFAEWASVSAELLAPKPAGLSYEQAAAVPLAGMTALQGLRDHGRVEREQRVLIVGASGGVGTFAVQIAKSLGAEVTGVCSATNVDLVRSLGADHVIDYTSEDFTRSGERYDLIFQLAGTLSPSGFRPVLTRAGTLIVSSGDSDGRWIGPLSRPVKALLLSPFVSQRLVNFTMKPNGEDLHSLTELIDAGEVTPVIDRRYPLAELPEAIRYQEQGHARGKVVVGVRP